MQSLIIAYKSQGKKREKIDFPGFSWQTDQKASIFLGISSIFPYGKTSEISRRWWRRREFLTPDS